MGGYAFFIKGVIEGEYYNLFKNAGRDTQRRIITSSGAMLKIRWGLDDKRVTLPAEKYQILAKDYIEFIKRSIEKPWESTKYIFRYLELNVTEIFLRGEQRNEEPEPEFYIQVDFRGCSGMCEISSALATHWAKIWFNQNKERLTQCYFRELGFIPNDSQINWTNKFSFLPIGPLGYALFNPGWLHDANNEVGYSRNFEVDHAVSDALQTDDTFKKFSNTLDTEYIELMKDGICRCQMCAKNYDVRGLNKVFGKFLY